MSTDLEFHPVTPDRWRDLEKLFVARPYRRQGVTSKLLTAAVEYAKQRSARIIEVYPVEPRQEQVAPVFVYTGLASAFRKANFVQVARRSETRPIMRYIAQ